MIVASDVFSTEILFPSELTKEQNPTQPSRTRRPTKLMWEFKITRVNLTVRLPLGTLSIELRKWQRGKWILYYVYGNCGKQLRCYLNATILCLARGKMYKNLN